MDEKEHHVGPQQNLIMFTKNHHIIEILLDCPLKQYNYEEKGTFREKVTIGMTMLMTSYLLSSLLLFHRIFSLLVKGRNKTG